MPDKIAKKTTKVKKEEPQIVESVKTVEVVSEEPLNKTNEKGFYSAVGRRKTATARARLYLFSAKVMVGGKQLNRGEVYVNGMPMDQYFIDPYAKELLNELYRTTNSANRFITTAKVEGSGKSGQAGAIALAVARALVKADPKMKPVLRKKGYMTRNPRSREREKPGLMGARKEKQSPKR